MGITDLTRTDCGPTITLGSCEVKMIDQAYAYSVFANNGKMYGIPSVQDLPEGFRELDPVAVLKIQDSEGKVLYEFKKPDERQVVKPEHAYMITDILSKQAIQWSRLTFGWPATSKTGTSEDFRDNVVMGFTPGPGGIVVDAWMGNADNTAMANNAFSSAGAGPMWQTFMGRAHEYLGIPKDDFPVPESIVTAGCGDRTEVFVKDQTPTKPGACRAPSSDPAGKPTPDVPRFDPRTFPSPTPSPEASPAETPGPNGTPVPDSTPDASVTPEPDKTPGGQGGGGGGGQGGGGPGPG
jgi:membrane peptidoglycan carboxypeptidase